ncbi:hypothetical protein ES703_71098 [subsurface metagenome]
MARTTKAAWKAWHSERERYRHRDSEGFTKDVDALEAHIQKLVELAPKDQAGLLNLNALDIIDLLRKDLQLARIIGCQVP